MPIRHLFPPYPGDLAMTPAAQSNSASQSTKGQQPTLTYWHVWTDEQGISHQTQCELTNFEQKSIAEGTAHQWNNRLLTSGANIMFTELPVNWVGEWHENPQPQWIVPLSGRWFVETMDGQRVEMGPGDVSFGGDQHTQPDDEGKKGHLSGTVGDVPAVLMIAQLNDEQWIAAKPGAFA
jgi:hypothetical protein